MKIGFLGFGNMAQAMAGGLVRSGAVQPGDIGACARDRAKLRSNTEPQGFRAFDDAAAVAEFADLVVVAVKPYQVEAVLAPVRELLAKKMIVVTPAATDTTIFFWRRRSSYRWPRALRSTTASGCSPPARTI